jgi:hypothetical protein
MVCSGEVISIIPTLEFMLVQCQGKLKGSSGICKGRVELGMVLHLSVNMVVLTINLLLKIFFAVYVYALVGKNWYIDIMFGI